MKETITKGLPAVILTPLLVYFEALGFPLILLIAMIVCDYCSGLTAAWSSATLSSRTGILGIVKKVCYLLLVAVGIVIDLVLNAGLGEAIPTLFGQGCHPIALLVVIWLIVNECLSILENLSEMGIPMPGFLAKIVRKLKSTLEQGGRPGEEEPHE